MVILGTSMAIMGQSTNIRFRVLVQKCSGLGFRVLGFRDRSFSIKVIVSCFPEHSWCYTAFKVSESSLESF
jgi:hypothetical protein